MTAARDKSEWFESFFGEMYGRVLALAFRPEQTLAQANLLRRMLRLRAGHRVLDVPCGQGRLTIPLAQAGMEMTGVDLGAAYLRAARAAARREGTHAAFRKCDMRRIAFDGEFDAAFNFFTSIGYFSAEGDLDFCRRVLRALRPGGRFLVETLNRPWIVPRFLPRVSKRVGDVTIVHRNRWEAATGRTDDTWTLRRGKKVERHKISLRLYGGRELKSLLAEAGFADIRLYGNPPLGPLTRASRRLIAVASRPV